MTSFDRSTFDVPSRNGTGGEVEGMQFPDQGFRRVKKSARPGAAAGGKTVRS